MKNIFTGIFVFVLIFYVYLSTLCPTVFVGDSGELITSSYSLGIAHPPGYPLYSFIGHIFTQMLPFAGIAFRVNLASAFFASLAVLFIFLIFLKLSSGSKPFLIFAVIAALCFGLSKTFWSQATDAEVYTLHMFLVSFILYILVLFKDSYKFFCLTGFLFGLSLVQHQTASLMILPIAISVFFNSINKKAFPKDKILFFSLFSVLGMSFYLYLPIRSLANPSIDWSNTETFSHIASHILRRQYGKISKFAHSFPLFAKQFGMYFELLLSQFTPWVALFIPFGLFKLFRANRFWFFQTLVVFLSFSAALILVLNYDISLKVYDIVKVFFLPSFLVASIWISFGVKFFLDYLKSRIVFNISSFLCALIIISIPFKSNYSENNLTGNYIAYNYGKNLLIFPENNSIFFIAQDNEVFTITYLNKTEDFRKNELKIYDELGCIYENIFGKDFLNISKAAHNERLTNIERQIALTSSVPVYFVFSSNLYRMDGVKSSQAGFVFKVESKNNAIGNSYLKNMRTANFSEIYRFKDAKEYLFLDVLAQYHFLLGKYYFSMMEKEKAMREFQSATNIGQEIEWVSSNVAKLLTDEGLLDEAIIEYEKEIKYFPKKPEARYRLAFAYNKKALLKETSEEGRKTLVNKAIEEYKKAVEFKPDYAEAYYNLGNIYMRGKMNDDAIIQYLNAIKYSPDKIDAYLNLGVVYEEKMEYNKAIEQYLTALKLKPDYVEAMNNIAGIYMAKNRYDDAIHFYQEAVKAAPYFADGYYNFGYCLARKGDFKNAVNLWKKTLELNPGHVLARQMLEKFKNEK